MITIKTTNKLFWLLFLMTCCQFSVAQSNTSVRVKSEHLLPHIASNIIVDAIMDEDAWQNALKIELKYETNPGENTLPPVKTEVFLFENGKTLFVAFNALDDNPRDIRDYLTDRDSIWDTDLVGIKFDTFGEGRKAFQFFTNALGVQADATQEDFRGDDTSWDAIWSSEGRITNKGYIVEMAIPLSALRFPDSGKDQSWGFEILRFLPRDVRHRIANTPVARNISCRICQFDRLVGLAKVKPSQNLRLIPTLVIGKSDSREEPATDPWNRGDIEQDAGLDFRWGITQDIFLNATINPDFSQVEADAAQLDINSTFSIFVPEKRPFFLDGASYFNSPNRLVHSRNIIEPDYGVKITGQSNGHSFGLFSVTDKHTSYLLPSNQGSEVVSLENQQNESQVLRYSQDLGNKNNIGLMVTNKTGQDYSNKVTSVDGRYWFNQNHSLTYQVMRSDSHYPDEVIEEYDAVNEKDISDNAYSLSFKHDSRNWAGNISLYNFGKNFRADLGFVGMVNYEKKVIGLTRRWYNDNKADWWHKINLWGDFDTTHDSEGFKLEKELEMEIRVEGQLQSEIGLGAGKRNRYYDDDLYDPDQQPGKYFDEKFTYLFAFMRPVAGLSLGGVLEWKDAIDFSNYRLGKSVRVSPEITWQLGQHWTTKLDYDYIDFDVPEGDLFEAKITNLRLTYQLDVRNSIRFTLQGMDIKRNPQAYLDEVDETDISYSGQLLYSYKLNPQTLFFAGYSDSGFQDDQLSSLKQTGKNLFMKFSYAWQL